MKMQFVLTRHKGVFNFEETVAGKQHSRYTTEEAGLSRDRHFNTYPVAARAAKRTNFKPCIDPKKVENAGQLANNP